MPHGDTPDEIRNNPALKGLNIPKTGQQGNVGLIVTKTLVILGDPQVTTTPEHPRGAMLRAYDKKTGQQVGAVWMPAPQSGSPMTYMVDGKQYIIVAVSGGRTRASISRVACRRSNADRPVCFDYWSKPGSRARDRSESRQRRMEGRQPRSRACPRNPMALTSS